MTAPEPESVRWVRYAADCAERVLPLAGHARPQAEAAIAAARRWADCPCHEHSRAAADAARATCTVLSSANDTTVCAWAMESAWAAAYTSGISGASRAANDDGVAIIAAAWATVAAHAAEQAWQSERRKHYGLREEGA